MITIWMNINKHRIFIFKLVVDPIKEYNNQVINSVYFSSKTVISLDQYEDVSV